MENWRPIEGYDGYYEVSDEGRIKSHVPWRGSIERIMSHGINGGGYPHVTLWKNGFKKSMDVHRLVANAFVEKTESKTIVNHIDGVKTNNRAINLEWCTYSENLIHSINMGFHPSGERSNLSKLTNHDVIQIRYLEGYFTQHTLAAMYGVSRQLIGQIHNYSIWNYI